MRKPIKFILGNISFPWLYFKYRLLFGIAGSVVCLLLINFNILTTEIFGLPGVMMIAMLFSVSGCLTGITMELKKNSKLSSD
jgi:hypothetical protein